MTRRPGLHLANEIQCCGIQHPRFGGLHPVGVVLVLRRGSALMFQEEIWQALGTGSGRASPLHPLGLHPLPSNPLVHMQKPIADRLAVREVPPIIGFGLRPLTSHGQARRPFGLGSDRQLAAFIKGPHMHPAPTRFGDPFNSSNRSPCFSPPPHKNGLPALRTNSRRGLNETNTFSLSLGSTPRGSTFSPRPDHPINPPDEAGVGLIVNGSARSPRAFHVRHADRIDAYTSHGSTPYPGVWNFPTLEPVV